jgi:hypothetical protein
MPETTRCHACSAPVAQQDIFCPECGVHLEPTGELQGAKPGITATARDDLDAVAAYAEYDSRKLTVLTGYVAGIWGWPIGLHRLYAKKPGWWLYLVVFILGVASLPFFGVGLVFFGLALLGLGCDLGSMSRWVEKYNRKLRQEIFGPPVGAADAPRPAEVARAHGRPNAQPRGPAGW